MKPHCKPTWKKGGNFGYLSFHKAMIPRAQGVLPSSLSLCSQPSATFPMWLLDRNIIQKKIQGVPIKDLALSLLWQGFDPQPRNFHIGNGQKKKKKKKKKRPKYHYWKKDVYHYWKIKVLLWEYQGTWIQTHIYMENGWAISPRSANYFLIPFGKWFNLFWALMVSSLKIKSGSSHRGLVG